MTDKAANTDAAKQVFRQFANNLAGTLAAKPGRKATPPRPAGGNRGGNGGKR